MSENLARYLTTNESGEFGLNEKSPAATRRNVGTGIYDDMRVYFSGLIRNESGFIFCNASGKWLTVVGEKLTGNLRFRLRGKDIRRVPDAIYYGYDFLENYEPDNIYSVRAQIARAKRWRENLPENIGR